MGFSPVIVRHAVLLTLNACRPIALVIAPVAAAKVLLASRLPATDQATAVAVRLALQDDVGPSLVYIQLFTFAASLAVVPKTAPLGAVWPARPHTAFVCAAATGLL